MPVYINPNLFEQYQAFYHSNHTLIASLNILHLQKYFLLILPVEATPLNGEAYHFDAVFSMKLQPGQMMNEAG